MNDNLNNQKPVEFFPAERIKIELDGQQILWRDMKLENLFKDRGTYDWENKVYWFSKPVKFVRCLDRQKRG